ncbi:MAG: hypothetical protein C4B55_05155 [Candidatus Methanophagaceae archaeon]|nr:MAG: hypothetical protein C4B55_05155 [Methanophagales archaeon]
MDNNKKKREEKGITAILLTTILATTVLAAATTTAAASSLTYTTCEDFEEGTLTGVECEDDLLQLSENTTTLPFIWVPNQEHTASKLNTTTGDELGRYRTCPEDVNGYPSRTTVDLQGNVWLGNRQAGTVVKIGLYENGQCVDRNGNGVVETSQDLNADGDISGAEMLPWGKDECVLFEVVLIPGLEGTYTPGDYNGTYADSATSGPRSIAVDAANNVWVGCFGSHLFYYLDGETGEILKTVNVSTSGHKPYGAVMDENGVLWSSGHDENHVLRLDPSTDPPNVSTVDLGHFVYGLGLDYLGHLFASGWDSYKLSKISTATATRDWTKTLTAPDGHNSRGVAVTSDNNVWVANSESDTVTRHDNDGNLSATISVGDCPTGVAVDADGKVWVCNLDDEFVHRIDPATDEIDLSKQVLGSGGHYSYSDMTGILVRSVTTKTGTWTVTFDSGAEETAWGKVSWNSDEPAGTSLTVRVRSSNETAANATWSAWETATNGVLLSSTPNARYLQVQTTLQIVSGETEKSPTLYDLTVETAAGPVPLPPPPPTTTPTISVTTDKTDYKTFDTMSVEIEFANPTNATQWVVYKWWLTIPGFDFMTTMATMPMTLPADYSQTFSYPIYVGYWGEQSFGALWGVALLDPGTNEIICFDTTYWCYKPIRPKNAGAETKKTPKSIASEIKEEIGKVGLPG